MNDTDTEYQRLKEVLNLVADLPSSEREARVRGILADDTELCERVLTMLRTADSHQEFFAAKLPDILSEEHNCEHTSPSSTQQKPHMVGSVIGPFTLGKVLGEGGMGVVYLAHQETPVEREVALKLISVHATTSQRMRFQRECRTLARFTHPNVTVMYQNGVSESGEPYAAMELVDGLPISKYCLEKQASIELRINLFLGACMGVAHAHEKGILHRDIKPSNILVTDVDGTPTAKVIDFGIATALDHDNDEDLTLTRQQLLGTPAYMSPESVNITDRESLDARSDVFSLGVVLFELVTGRRPHDASNLALVEWVNFLATAPSPSASKTYAALSDKEREQFAREAGTTPRMLDRVLHSDLAAVLHKALALEPSDRYASSRELADDLKRHLRGEAVLAHPPSKLYSAGKFVRRYWLGISAIFMLVVFLSGGIVVRSQEVKRTRLALEESSAISGFLVDLIQHASPLRTEDDDVSLQAIIDRGSVELEDRFSDQPLVRARLLHTLGSVYSERGQIQKGVEMMQQAVDLMEAAPQKDELALIALLSDLGSSLRRMLKTENAETVLLRAMELATPLIEEEPLLVANVANSLGNLYLINSEFELAEKYHRQTLQLRLDNLPPDDVQIASAYNNIATDLTNSWRTQNALPYAEKALAGYQAGLPQGHPWIGLARNNIAIILAREGRWEESVEVLNKSLQEAVHRLGPTHLDVANHWRNLSYSLLNIGKREEAYVAMQNYVDILMNALGKESQRTLTAQRRQIYMRSFGRNNEQILTDYQRNLAMQIKVEGEYNIRTVATGITVAGVLVDLNRFAEADTQLSALIPLLLEVTDPGHYQVLNAKLLQARSVGKQGDPESAVKLLDKLLEEAKVSLFKRNSLFGRIYEEYSIQEARLGCWSASVNWAQKALSLWSDRHEHLHTARARGLLGEAYLGAGQQNQAHKQFAEAVALYALLLPEDYILRKAAKSRLAELERPRN
ncbi:MAG: serine/threonine-protein kinase [Xanthomonadales bacterium]|nr:serine/threonine-protein kinase [Xanthomonadales bacterium]